jgi:3-methyladenine DNA glycosylase AlkD
MGPIRPTRPILYFPRVPVPARISDMATLAQIRRDLREHASEKKAAVLQRFFKTGPGEYGEGDRFIGVQVPAARRVAKRHAALPLRRVRSLLRSPVHEERLLALLILVQKFGRADPAEQQEIYDFYLAHTGQINNWDLVDLSADKIVGAYLLPRKRAVLRRLARSEDLWERRIAIVATFCFIRQGQFEDTLEVAGFLLHDEHDLIHKAVGWMLREVGKRDLAIEEGFLARYYRTMPRTMLRYAIERFAEPRRQAYLRGDV